MRRSGLATALTFGLSFFVGMVGGSAAAPALEDAIDVTDGLGRGEDMARERVEGLLRDIEAAHGLRFRLAAPLARTTSAATPGADGVVGREAVATREAVEALFSKRAAAVLIPDHALLRRSQLFNAMRIPFFVRTAAEHAGLLAGARPRWADLLLEHGLVLLAVVPMRPVAQLAPHAKALADATRYGDAGTRRLDEIRSERKPVAGAAAGDLTFHSVDWQGLHLSPAGEVQGIITFWPVALLVARSDRLFASFADRRKSVLDSAAASEARWFQQDGADGAAAWQATRQAFDDFRLHEPSLRWYGLQLAREWAIDAGADGFALLKSLGVELDDEKR